MACLLSREVQSASISCALLISSFLLFSILISCFLTLFLLALFEAARVFALFLLFAFLKSWVLSGGSALVLLFSLLCLSLLDSTSRFLLCLPTAVADFVKVLKESLFQFSITVSSFCIFHCHFRFISASLARFLYSFLLSPAALRFF